MREKEWTNHETGSGRSEHKKSNSSKMLQNGSKSKQTAEKTTPKCKKCKLIIIVVSALSFPLYCLSTDQLVYRCGTQTTETNFGLIISTGGRQTSLLFTCTSAAEGF